MSKANGKKYNPRKSLARAGAGAELQAAVLSRNVLDAMSDSQVMMQTARMLSALDQHKPGQWDSFACRAMSHYYRVCVYLAQSMKLERLAVAAREGQQALMRIVNQPDEIPVVTKRDYEALRAMCLSMINLIKAGRVSKTTWGAAMAFTMREFTGAVQEQFDGIHPELRAQAVAVIEGKKVPDAARELGITELAMVDAAIEVAMIAHAMLDDSLVPLPNKIAIVRKVADKLIPATTDLNTGRWRVARLV